jgi:glucose-1-phosphate cytidylyltransferase
MQVVVLAGGLGTRLAEETGVRPKPMVDVGGMPILWHILKSYSAHGFDDFVIALGYKGDHIKDFFLGYNARTAPSLMVETASGSVEVGSGPIDDWRVRLVETGLLSQTGGRVKRVAPWLVGDTFCLTYGDGVADVDLRELVAFHQQHGRLATVTAVRPASRFGGLVLDGNEVADFVEKPQIGEGWINGGFMVLQREVLDRIAEDGTSLESDVLEGLANDNQLMAYRHEGFWQSMDTLRETTLLRELWSSGKAPWKVWA